MRPKRTIVKVWFCKEHARNNTAPILEWNLHGHWSPEAIRNRLDKFAEEVRVDEDYIVYSHRDLDSSTPNLYAGQII